MTPKIPLFGVDFANTIFRLDTAVSILFSFFCAIWVIRYKISLLPALISIFFLFTGPLNGNVGWITSLISASYATLFVISAIVAKEIGGNINTINFKIFNYSDLLLNILFINSIIGLLSRLSGFALCQDVSYAMVDSTRCLIDEYGITGAPYIFGAYSVALIVLSAKKSKLLFLIVGLVSLLLSDSRAFAASFLPLIIFLIIRSREMGAIKYMIPIAAIAVIPFIGTKTVSGFQGDQLTDHSFMMRFMIYEDFINWLDPVKFFIGGGANAFFEFATQYEMPGHPDNLYIRLISEVGIVGLMAIFILLFTSRKKVKLDGGQYIVYIAGLLILGLAQESLLAVKSGHMIAFLLGYLQNSNKYVRKVNQLKSEYPAPSISHTRQPA